MSSNPVTPAARKVALQDDLDQVRAAALRAVESASDEPSLEQVRVEYLGRKGRVTESLTSIGTLAPAERAWYGKAANDLKGAIAVAVEARSMALARDRLAELAETELVDLTFPAPPLPRGHLHLLTRIQRQLERTLESIGYHVQEGPEVELDWYNFGALNFPEGHAARDAQDSFFFTDKLLLRTHTSPVQIRAMERLGEPPIHVVVPGRCYRRDAIDATHLASFMQFEGLAVDHDLAVSDLKGTLLYMLQAVYGEDRRIRFRPHFFPFTEPSFEFDISCGVCKGEGCRSCGQEGWLELGGCGMVHPQVLRHGGIDPEQYTGFAWGFGIERIAMQRHAVEDLRLFYENDLRFLEQF